MKKKESFGSRLKKDMIRNKWIYVMAIPVILFYVIFCYVPMGGVIIAFKDYNVRLGILKSPWVGLQWFRDFFSSYSFMRILRNTIMTSLLDIIFGFPAPIIFALLLNELRSSKLKKFTQTMTYIPYFISLVVICGLMIQFLGSDGLITNILTFFGAPKVNYLGDAKYFWTVYTISGIWQGFGWGSIIYIAAISGIDQGLYEAALIDGANRWKRALHITMPSIMPTIIVMFILRMGSILSVGSEKTLLLYTPTTYETADIISTYIFRKGLIDGNYAYSTAVNLLNSAICFLFLIITNQISKKVSETSLW